MVLRVNGDSIPDIVVVAFFSEGCTDSGTLLLHNSSLISNSFGGAHIADELLDWALSVWQPH